MTLMDETTAPAPTGRPTLKLKSRPAAKREVAAPQPREVAPRPQTQSPKAAWSEQYIRQMQAEMDALAGR
jgi:hypothetical protein